MRNHYIYPLITRGKGGNFVITALTGFTIFMFWLIHAVFLIFGKFMTILCNYVFVPFSNSSDVYFMPKSLSLSKFIFLSQFRNLNVE